MDGSLEGRDRRDDAPRRGRLPGLTVSQVSRKRGAGAKPILEINPAHPMVERLKGETPRFEDWSALLYEQALLAEGGQLEDPAGFVKRLNDLMLTLAGKSGAIEFRVEAFNVFNRPNFSIPNRVVFAGDHEGEAPLSTAGIITSTANDARQMQLGVKIKF